MKISFILPSQQLCCIICSCKGNWNQEIERRLKGTDEDRRRKIEKSEKNSVILVVFIKLYKKKKILTFCTKGLLNWNIEKVTFWNYINVSFMLKENALEIIISNIVTLYLHRIWRGEIPNFNFLIFWQSKIYSI